ncbi:hypothetical protein Bbelb_145050 [Branchiostoma belcheri]|nr:hypothetical protein Bbelb_145050 [Branchiostoma belcheri]
MDPECPAYPREERRRTPADGPSIPPADCPGLTGCTVVKDLPVTNGRFKRLFEEELPSGINYYFSFLVRSGSAAYYSSPKSQTGNTKEWLLEIRDIVKKQ